MSLAAGQTLLKLGLNQALNLDLPAPAAVGAAIVGSIIPFAFIGKIPVPGGFIPAIPAGAAGAIALLSNSLLTNRSSTKDAADEIAQCVSMISPAVHTAGLQALKKDITSTLDTEGDSKDKADQLSKCIKDYYSRGGAR